jgi:predicted short-subunit dehydrogenase-like oxidoreductase (DUF2520 family)
MSRARYAILGAGKVGVALHRAIRRAGLRCRLVPARARRSSESWDETVLILAVRDAEIGPLAADLARRNAVSGSTVVVHVSGVLSSSVLAPLVACAGVAQMHPLLSFASREASPDLEGAHMHIEGTSEGVRRARRIASLIGMCPRVLPAVDPAGYHAAAAMLANGAAAVAAAAIEILVASGVPREIAPRMLAPLLRSVAQNLGALGMPAALTGPVRRGNLDTIERHLAVVDRVGADVGNLYRALVIAQIPPAREIGEASDESLHRIAQRIAH